MTRPTDPYADLAAVIRERRAVLVAGTGISIAATRADPRASWAGLLKNGLEWLRAHELISEGKAQAHLSLMEEEGAETHHFVSAAQDIVKQMGGQGSVHFKTWLEETVGSLVPTDRGCLIALDALRGHGNLLATTNYDSLLQGESGRLTPVTWSQGEEFLTAVRRRQIDAVLYLHGYWRRPESVILDWSSYERISRDSQYRDDLAAVLRGSTWVYVGCGLNGLADPDLGLLLERYGRRLRAAGLWDYLLVCRDQQDELQAHFDKHDLNIVAVTFGTGHGELASFLRTLLPAPQPRLAPSPVRIVPRDTRPQPPDLYAVPDYLGGHEFVGRDSELHDLDDWALAADPTNMLLFEAIGGSGKSMLTWKWVNDRAQGLRTDWAGRFWYSFYERGAVVADFCRHALAYMTGQPVRDFERLHTPELAPRLLDELHAKPWLVVLDGMERVLVAYHRIDAAELPDEAADDPTDVILDRTPTATIRDEDSDILRLLAGARPSKVLVTSRLTPRVLLNPAGQPIPGVKRQPLAGLRPADAEAMFRASGVRGESARIRRYLTENCDNHPLVVGVLAGLVVNHLPARDDFDVWEADAGRQLDLAGLDLVQRRHHILWAALDDLSRNSRELLSTLAMYPESIDYETLAALNPLLPTKPAEVLRPALPESQDLWQLEQLQETLRRRHQAAAERHEAYERELASWRQSPEVLGAVDALAESMRDLEQRGLLQYDHGSRRHDLHPVVRGVAAGGLHGAELQRHGQRLVDLFSSALQHDLQQTRTFEDVAPALNLVRTLVQLGRLPEAVEALRHQGLDLALWVNLEAHVETLAILRPFFGRDWSHVHDDVASHAYFLGTSAGIALEKTGHFEAALAAYGVVVTRAVAASPPWGLSSALRNVAVTLLEADRRPAKALQLIQEALELSTTLKEDAGLFRSRLLMFSAQTELGWWTEAAEMWGQVNAMGRNWPRGMYLAGAAELSYAYSEYMQGRLREEHLSVAAELARAGRNRRGEREVHRLRGIHHVDGGNWRAAAESLSEAVRMARERRLLDAASEAALVLSKYRLLVLTAEDARQEALRLSRGDAPHRWLAMIWQALGDAERAAEAALAAYKDAWADGEPYVFRYDLDQAMELLKSLGVPVPNMPPYDPEADKPFPWEIEVRAAIDRAREEEPA
jgi:tetratricopeptide (TPR) repeat protein